MDPMFKYGWLVFLFLSLNVTAQQKRVILTEDFLAMLTSPKGDTLRLDNIKIVRGENIDLHLLPNAIASVKIFDKQLQNLDTLHIYKLVDLRNVELEWDFTFRRIRFHNNVWLENCENTGITFSRCRFDSTLYVTSQAKSSTLFLSKCVVKSTMDLNGIGSFTASLSQFFDRNDFRGEITDLHFQNCDFVKTKADSLGGWAGPAVISLREISVQGITLELFKSTIRSAKGAGGLDFFSVNFEYLNIQHSVIEAPVQAYLAFMNRCIVEQSAFSGPIDFREIGLPTGNTNIPFEQISRKIVVKNSFLSQYGKRPDFYQAINDNELNQPSNYNELIAVYSKFLAAYKYRGDQKSYNACYIEMKDIAARKAQFDYRQNPTLEGFFEWRLAQFLKTFCDYGTSPVKSLLFSFYVILAFAGLYFLFPSEDDNVSKRSLSRFISSAVDYFKTDKQLLDFQVENQEAELQIMTQLGEKLEQAKQGTPGILLWIGRPFYAWMSVYHRFMIWFYNRTDLVKGQWSKLSAGRRLWLGILVSGYFVVFVLSGLLVRVLNALALSLNVFVTLGYGEISARGAMRYFAVLEGLLGWFLLSIFSVSLIGQVLQ